MPISKQEQQARQERVIRVAYELFCENQIEAVSMQNIADAAKVGVASVFRYYESKPDLVIAVSGYAWNEYLKSIRESRPLEVIKDIPAIERMRYTLDMYIDMYQNHKELLRFNDNFNHYIIHEHVDKSMMTAYSDVVNPVLERFHLMYEKAKIDKTMRTDIQELELLRTTVHTMMGACHHYAGGFIWGAADDINYDYTPELTRLRDMILDYISI